MSTPKFTPGPWRAHRTSIGFTIKAEWTDGPKNGVGMPMYSLQFAKVWETDPNGETPLPFESNARLIAAAPALYGSLQVAIDALVRLHPIEHDYLLDCDCEDAKAFQQISDAMTLVDGGVPRRTKSEAVNA